MRNYITFLLMMITFGHTPMWAKNPVASAHTIRTGIITVGNAMSVALDGSASYDPDGWIVEYKWYQLGTSPTELIFNTPAATKTSTAPVLWRIGTYQVVLQVKDNQGAFGRDTVNINIKANEPPQINAGLDQKLSYYKGGCITGTVNVSMKDPDGTIVSISSDMPVKPDGWKMLQSGQTTKIQFSKAGSYTLLITIKDNAGSVATDIVNFTISEKPCDWWRWFTRQCSCSK